MEQLIVRILVVAVLLASSMTPVEAQIASPKKTIKVKIFLLDVFESENLLENTRLLPVERVIDAKSPLRSAIEAQIVGATAEENSQGLHSPVNEINLISLTLKNKTVYARFARTEPQAFDKTVAARFRNAVRRTALQFPGVKKVLICLDGVLNFQSEAANQKPQPCE